MGRAEKSLKKGSRGSGKKSARRRDALVVGVGTDAGGTDALLRLLDLLPPDFPGAIVVVHTATSPAALAGRLAANKAFPVHKARHRLRVRPGAVYVLPPNCHLTIQKGTLSITPWEEAAEKCMPIDHFLRSLAVDQKSRAVGLLLSGDGEDGTLGLKAIKAEGGIAIAQDPRTAAHPAKPRAAAGEGDAHFAASIERIAQELQDFARAPRGPVIALEDGEHLEKIFALIRQASGVDFSDYKGPTLKRRVARRIALLKLKNARAYLDYLERQPDEIHTLYEDVLIRVTRFFRDPRAFWALSQKVYPALLKRHVPGEPLRVWVAGCSTGEEVYSIAITLLEFLEARGSHAPLQIFGTDINDSALRKARAGVYPANIAMDVSEERLRRFFTKGPTQYTVNKSVRDICLFARQDVTRDPPFSKIDLVSCRNVLIYLGQNLQHKVFSIFHYALNPAGFLLLGGSETIHGFTDRFTVFDKKNNVFCKRLAAARAPFSLQSRVPKVPALDKDFPVAKGSDPSWNAFDLHKEVDRLLLNKFGPAAALVNDDMEVLQARGRIGAFLELAPGKASLNLMKMAKDGLFVDLRALLQKVKKTKAPARRRSFPLQAGKTVRAVDIEVLPVASPFHKERYYLIVFQEAAPAVSWAKLSKDLLKTTRSDGRPAAHIERELAATKDYLQKIIDDQEATNEELKAANEETLSSNEELQSTNEELETAKEELQSTNEELTTVNEELRVSFERLKETTDQLAEAQSVAQMGSWMWDVGTNTVTWSDELYRIYGLVPQEFQLGFDDFLSRVHPDDRDGTRAKIQAAFDGGDAFAFDHRILRPDRSVRVLHARGRVARDADGKPIRMHGTGQDLTDLRHAQETLRLSEERFRLMVESVQDYAIFALDADGRVASWNLGAKRAKGYEAGEIIGKHISAFYAEEDRRAGKANTLLEKARRDGRVEDEGWRVRKDGTRFWADVVITALRDTHNRVIGFTKVTRDLTERRAADEALRRANDELEARVEERTRELAAANETLRKSEEELRRKETELRVITDALPVLIAYIDTEHRYRFNNRGYAAWFGMQPEDIRGRHMSEVLGASAYRALLPAVEQALSGEQATFESEVPYKFGGTRHVQGTYIPDAANGGVQGFFVLVSDMSERKRTEEKIKALNAELERKVAERTEELRFANKELESFCYSVSHDLRAPLRSIDGFSQAILEDAGDKLGPQEKGYFDRIRAASQRMAELIDDLLDLSRLSRKALTHEPLDLTAMAEAVVDELHRAQPGRAVDAAVAPSLKAAGDATLVRVVLQNLIENAWKFTGRTAEARVEIGQTDAGMNGDGPVFYVKDNGAGFDMAHANKLFGPFQRLHGVEEFSGTGIGLATVQRIVTRHGGRIWADAAVDRGATFYFTLGPRTAVPEDVPAPS